MDEVIVSSTMDKFGIIFETQSFKSLRKVYRIQFNQLAYHQFKVITYSTIEPVLWKESTISTFDDVELSIKYDSYTSFDGTKVLVTIIQKKTNDICRKPCLIYANGGFGDCLLPKFDLFLTLFIELFNGVVGSYTHSQLFIFSCSIKFDHSQFSFIFVAAVAS